MKNWKIYHHNLGCRCEWEVWYNDKMGFMAERHFFKSHLEAKHYIKSNP